MHMAFSQVIKAAVLPLAFLLDLIVGDPRWLPHPVRFMGQAVGFLEKAALTLTRSPAGKRLAGIIIVVVVAGGSFTLTWLLLDFAFTWHAYLGFALSALILYSMLAVKDLAVHVRQVLEALQDEDLPLARQKVGWLVSRDTASLDEAGVVRAALESLFENTADGVTAPLFYAALGGPALAVLYKAVNTMDSMIGYKNERYYYLGWAAARVDDLFSYIPARLTALLYFLAAFLTGRKEQPLKQTWSVLLRDRKKHDSPNSAWPVVAAASVLDVRLGGTDLHRGVLVERPLLNAKGRLPGKGDLEAALSLFQVCCWLSAAAALVLFFCFTLALGVFA